MKKTFEIEDNMARGFVARCCAETVNRTGTIDDDLIFLKHRLGRIANDKARNGGALQVGRGGSHIWISDIWNKRVAIIYYREVTMN